MPWLETAPVEERIRFIGDALSDRFTMSELCARYGISRRVGYNFRRKHPFWGARKLLRVLATRHPSVTEWPAPSTAEGFYPLRP